MLDPADNPLIRAAGRLPAGVHTKLLVAFVGTALLVVGVGVLGLRLLGQSNDRVATLGTLQERSFAYAKLRSDASYVRDLVNGNVQSEFHKVFKEGRSKGRGYAAVRAIDLLTLDAAKQLPSTTYPDTLGFVPAPEDERFLHEVRTSAEQLSRLMDGIIKLAPDHPVPPGTRTQAESLARHLNQYALELSNATRAKTSAVIAQNASAYERSRNLFIAAAAGAILLALALGFVLSWSLIG